MISQRNPSQANNRSLLFILTLLALVVFPACEEAPRPDAAATTPPVRVENAITGVVEGERGPVGGATVRVQTTDRAAITAADGRFSLPVEGMGQDAYKLTAWAPGYFCAGPVEAQAGQDGVVIQLHAHASEDNPDYAWLPSRYYPGEGEDQGCVECHSAVGAGLDYTLPVDEWTKDAHASSALNTRFLTMYAGTDVVGNQSPLTRYGYSRDYGSFPLRPDPDEPYYGPGYKLDFPNTAGNCAACHTPAASIDAPYQVDPRNISGVSTEGVPCDFCHKIWDVALDPESGLPYANMPGVLSYEFKRPPQGHQFFAGPYDDVAPGEDTYAPIQTKSQFCAPCHFGVFWDVVVYDSFGEWLRSSYSDPQNGQTCQDCHMPSLGATHFALPDKGGLERNPDTIFSHQMPGAMDEELLRSAVSMDVEARQEGDDLVVQVRLTNDKTGHNVPTDSPLRHMILLVRASDASGIPLAQTGGESMPEWTGVGNPEDGCYANLPGKVYAKVLEELWTEVSPSGAYWKPTRLLSDNRLAPFATDSSVYTFSAPEEGRVEIEVKLLFRRAYKQLVDQKGWDLGDILMSSQSINVIVE